MTEEQDEQSVLACGSSLRCPVPAAVFIPRGRWNARVAILPYMSDNPAPLPGKKIRPFMGEDGPRIVDAVAERVVALIELAELRMLV